MRISRLAGLLVATCLLLPLLARADVTLAGVKYEDTTDLRGARLTLNGAGIRYKGPFKVYTAALYLQKKAGTPEDVLALPGAKRMSVVMLRDIDASELGRLFIRGVEDNMDRGAMAKLIPGLMRMSQIFTDHKNLKAGDQFTLDWVPGAGTVVSVRGVQQGEPFKEPEFFSALMRIWLGPVPADWKLKDSLLGKPA
ncbi:chalcone isomerase family protein [Ramlibacter ginsenosidimutans]|uniref:Chalcone isomerase family protein n=1 Tax=Ramlibacter ginsenosidimutans TaxID=502333 RepID=A0A934WLR7_9BURK|nr:chalcone isomerase family protein [Ramlibacter ginsenosidimutans]MBK6005387.1 chalcone isomerase family protein [Ramlibacter ginsenosidimutans]